MTHKAIVIVLGILLTSSLALSGEKRFTRKTIDRLAGQVPVLMPCNWIPSRHITVTGRYGETLTEQPMPLTQLIYDSGPLVSGTNRYVIVQVAPEEKNGLAEIGMTFGSNDKRCPDDIGQKNFTQ